MGRLTRIKPQLSRAAPLVSRCDDALVPTPSRDRIWGRLYNTARWKKLRKVVLLRSMFTCRLCGRLEGNTGLLVCDHIKAHRGDERLFFDEANLQCLCKPCHDAIKQKEEQASLKNRGVWY